MADSVDPTKANFMHWYTPDLPTLTYPDTTCNALDPITFNVNSQELHAMLYVEIPNHPGPSGNCNIRAGSLMSVQMAPTDFTDWKMVTLRQPAAGEARTVFYNVPALRTATELVLQTPCA